MESLLSYLPLLACPVGMGLIMWMMMRGNKQPRADAMAGPVAGGQVGASTADADQDVRLAQLRAQLDEVQAQQAAIATQIERLSAEDSSAEPVDRSVRT